MLKMIQIQAVRFTHPISKMDNIALFGLIEEGVVYQYRFDREQEGWEALRMVEVKGGNGA